MFKKSKLATSVLLAMVLPTAALAEVTSMTIELKNETAMMTKDGQLTGQAQSTTQTRDFDNAGDVVKFENSAKIFLNGNVGEESTWHAELKLVYDAKAVDDDNTDWNWRGHESNTQQDFFRELYMDTEVNDWYMRIGKQQQVWGTADGIKLLDIINPTDYREWAQGDIEESRIPVWMVSAEKNFDNGGNLQFIVAEAQENVVAGLSSIDDNTVRNSNSILTGTPAAQTVTGVDSGHLFVMKGVDTISGPVNGFMNIGSIFGPMTAGFYGGGFTNPGGGLTVPGVTNGQAEGFTVGGFTAIPAGGAVGLGCGPVDGALCLEGFTEAVNQQVTNLIDVTSTDGINGVGWNTANPNSMWEYMPNATFATFNAFVGMTTKYVRDYENDVDGNFGARFRNTTDAGLNWGVNYLYAYDPNPVVNVHWADPNTGERLTVNEYKVKQAVSGVDTSVYQLTNSNGNVYGAPLVNYSAAGAIGPYVGAAPVDVGAANAAGSAQLVFTETRERIHNIGSSFDYATNMGDTPLVLRGEFLYQKDVYQPVINREKLAKGDIVGALTTEKNDFFKYVIGADVTVLTNLLVSGQFIQQINLDFKDQAKTCATQDPAFPSINCSTYTADPSTMHLTNGLQKGYEYKEFYSLFFSKPIGEEQLGRWNNITMYEDGGGWWNRFNADYSVSDNFIVTGAWNNYWGDENTTFGQFKDSSSVEVGFKYIFENY